MDAARAIFGARAQVIVGALFLAATGFQAVWWGFLERPSTAAVFWLSVEALLFAAFAVIGNGLGYRATERVEAAVTDN